MILISILLIISVVEHFFMKLLTLCKFSLKKMSIQVLCPFLNGVLWLLLLFAIEKAMAPHSSTLAWQIPWTREPGGLQSMGSLRVGHD